MVRRVPAFTLPRPAAETRLRRLRQQRWSIVRVVGVHRRRNRSLVAAPGPGTRSRAPATPSRRRPGADVARQFGGSGDVAQPREQPDGHAHATRSASRAPCASSGSAVAPSIQTSPPSKNSRFQIGRDLFHALDRVAAGGEGVGPMRRSRRDGDTGLADLEAAGAVMQRQPHARPAFADLGSDPLECRSRQRLVHFVLQIVHAPPEVVVPDQPQERRDRPIRPRPAFARRRPRRSAARASSGAGPIASSGIVTNSV